MKLFFLFLFFFFLKKMLLLINIRKARHNFIYFLFFPQKKIFFFTSTKPHNYKTLKFFRKKRKIIKRWMKTVSTINYVTHVRNIKVCFTVNNASNGSDHIFWSFAATTNGLAFAISSRPADLKSNVHPWTSGYLWVPQKVVPHRHMNPVNPTRFLHTVHRLGRCCWICFSICISAAWIWTTGAIVDVEIDWISGDDGGDAAEREDSTVDFMEACCWFLRQRSP